MGRKKSSIIIAKSVPSIEIEEERKKGIWNMKKKEAVERRDSSNALKYEAGIN